MFKVCNRAGDDGTGDAVTRRRRGEDIWYETGEILRRRGGGLEYQRLRVVTM
jgi:hypothetical protein